MVLFGLPIALLLQESPLMKLSFLLGDWESKETTKGPDGKDLTFTLKGKNRWILDGTTLRIEESFEIPGVGKFENLILMTYDARDKVYRAWWFTNRGAKPVEFSGKFTDANFELAGERLRINYKPTGDGTYDATLEVLREGKWESQTVAKYRRTAKVSG